MIAIAVVHQHAARQCLDAHPAGEVVVPLITKGRIGTGGKAMFRTVQTAEVVAAVSDRDAVARGLDQLCAAPCIAAEKRLFRADDAG